jgi:hypothetical protein
MFVEFVAVATTAVAVHICPRSYLVPRVQNLKTKVVNSLKPAHQWSQRSRRCPTTAEVAAAATIAATFVIAVLNIINSESS